MGASFLPYKTMTTKKNRVPFLTCAGLLLGAAKTGQGDIELDLSKYGFREKQAEYFQAHLRRRELTDGVSYNGNVIKVSEKALEEVLTIFLNEMDVKLMKGVSEKQMNDLNEKMLRKDSMISKLKESVKGLDKENTRKNALIQKKEDEIAEVKGAHDIDKEYIVSLTAKMQEDDKRVSPWTWFWFSVAATMVIVRVVQYFTA